MQFMMHLDWMNKKLYVIIYVTNFGGSGIVTNTGMLYGFQHK